LTDFQRTLSANKTKRPSSPNPNMPKTPKRAARVPPKSDPPNPRAVTATTNSGTQRNEKN
jgi:hypothetical protein